MSHCTGLLVPFLTVPNELLLQIANHLTSPADVASLLRTNRRLALLLDPVLDQCSLLNWPESDSLLVLPPLPQAAMHGHVGRAKRLLRLGAKIHTVGEIFPDQSTALARAVMSHKIEMIHLLLDNGANLYFGHDGPLADALTIALRQAMWHMLHKRMEFVKWTTDYERTLMDIARILLNHHNINLSAGVTVPPGIVACWLHEAVVRCQDDLTYIQLLLDYGLPVEDSNALYTAVDQRLSAVADLLLRYGDNPLKKGQRGETPVDVARRKGQHEVLEILLKYVPEALCEDRSDNGEKLLEMASSSSV